jgi:deoxyribonuclease V
MKHEQPDRHPWNMSPADAVKTQKQLAGRVIEVDDLPPIRHVAGVDVGIRQQGRVARAAVAVLDFPALELVDCAVAERELGFPYIPGLLSFRELPAVLDAMAILKTRPDLLLCDGQGYAHPRRFGIACHLGVLTGMASIGVGKTRLLGEYAEPGADRGDWTPLYHRGETIGAVLRTRPGCKPLFISRGHRVSLATAIEYVMQCTTRFKLPETTRHAHRLASETGGNP